MNQEIECFDGITLKVSSVVFQNGIVSITSTGHNDTDEDFIFSSDSFELSGQNTSNLTNHDYLSPTAAWSSVAEPNSDFTLYQSYSLNFTDYLYTYTLTLFDKDHKKAGQFLLVSDN